MKRGRHLTLWQVFRAPVGIAMFSLLGLIAALLGDDAWDTIGAAALASTVGATLWALAKRRQD